MNAEWAEWRKKGVGASDSPIIMGVSDFKTPLMLYEEKLGIASHEKDNTYITDKGNREEPRARAMYELQRGVDAPPKLVTHAEHLWLRASLDGLASDRFAEFKFVGKGEKWEQAKAGIVAPCYVPQVQHQCFVTGLPGDYVCWNGEEIAIVEVLPDMDYLANEWFPKVQAFWFNHVLKTVPPPESDKDYKLIRDKDVQELLLRYQGMKKNYDEIGDVLDLLKTDIFAKIEHRRFKWKDIKIVPKTRAGNIDYKKLLGTHLPQLPKEEIEKFRGKDIVYKEIRI